MRILRLLPLIVSFLIVGSAHASDATRMPDSAKVIETMDRVNAYFMKKWPDVAKPIVTNRTRPSNIWTRGVYYEGLMALNAASPKSEYLNYAVTWGEAHKWGLRNGTTTRNADDQCCGQTYLDLYLMDPRPERLTAIKANIDFIIASGKAADWTWIDAMQMGMPVYAKLYMLTGDARYLETMHAQFVDMKTKQGGHGLYNQADGLWWRDADFVPPYKEPNGEDCYWSRGNGWVIAALARTLEILPESYAHRGEYLQMFKEMSEALRKVQRADGLWNVSLHDPTHFGGPEVTGSALFAYAFAWGVRHGVLDGAVYRPVINRAWTAMAGCVRAEDGFLGYVQGTGKEPKDGQPVGPNNVPDFEDYGIGCFLLAGAEIVRLERADTAAALAK